MRALSPDGANNSSGIRRYSTSDPCPVCCAGTRGCSATADGLHWCRGSPQTDEWVDVKDCGNGFHCFRRRDDPPPRPTTTAPPRDWQTIAAGYAAALTPERKADLAAALSLPAEAIHGIDLVGWNESEQCWTFPERDGSGAIIGIMRRFHNNEKKLMYGGHRGLMIPRDWQQKDGAVFLVEGQSNTIALSHCGLKVIGRPNNMGGVEHLATLLRHCPAKIIVVGDNDERDSKTKPGTKEWPGREGAESTTKKLSDAIQDQTICWAMPPDGVKDCRDWILDEINGWGNDSDPWLQIGSRIRESLAGGAAKSTTESSQPSELQVESLFGLRPKPVRWLVRDRIPAGMQGLLAAEGGQGKTTTTLELAAAISTGRCAFGLTYPDPPKGKALPICCEDDWERTIIPRLAALGADLRNILRIRGVRMKAGGELLDFNLGHFSQLKHLLNSNPDIHLAVIDPAGAYIGRAGINEHKDAELRQILDPLNEIANETGATILLIKHLNKSAGASAVQRVSGSVGYVNAVRFAYMIAPDPDDQNRKLMLPIKANVLPAGQTGLAYRMLQIPADDGKSILRTMWPDLDSTDLDELAKQLFKQHWEDGIVADANTVAAGGRNKKDPTKVLRCKDWLKTILKDYAYPSTEIVDMGKDAGYTFDNIKEAKKELKAENLNNCNQSWLGNVWWSGFGEPKDWKLRPDS